MYSFMTSEKQSNMSAEKLDSIFKALPSGIEYKFDRGFLLVNPENKDAYEIWGVNFMTEDKDLGGKISVLKGDLMMSLDDGKNSEILYYRHLRRVR